MALALFALGTSQMAAQAFGEQIFGPLVDRVSSLFSEVITALFLKTNAGRVQHVSSILSRQVAKSIPQASFDYLAEQLGEEMVNAIPTVSLPEGILEDDYPLPWEKAEDLPADIVKGVLPSGRPFLAVRYCAPRTSLSGNQGEDELHLEFFFQRYSVEHPMSVIFHGSIQGQVEIEETEEGCADNWVATQHLTKNPIFRHSSMRREDFQILREMFLGGRPGGRYLPMYEGLVNPI